MSGEGDLQIRHIVDLCNNAGEDLIDATPQREINPGDFAPALVMRDGKLCAAPMRWGFANTKGGLVINARSEDVHDRPMFQRPVQEGRCVLPSSGYFEWRRGDGQKYLIAGKDVVYMAGLYRMEEDGRGHFVVLTRAAYGKHVKIHHRMPVVLSEKDQCRAWLSGQIGISGAMGNESDELVIEALYGEQVQFDFDSFVD